MPKNLYPAVGLPMVLGGVDLRSVPVNVLFFTLFVMMSEFLAFAILGGSPKSFVLFILAEIITFFGMAFGYARIDSGYKRYGMTMAQRLIALIGENTLTVRHVRV